MKPFVTLDGEGYRDDAGNDLYNLLGASDGSYIRNDKGLRSSECFNYLIDLVHRFPTAIFVGFAFGYDVNNIIRTLPLIRRDFLARNEHCYVWGKHDGVCWKIEYIPRKKFTLSKGVGWFVDAKTGERLDPNDLERYQELTQAEGFKRKLHFEGTKGERIVIYDVWGFFQSSFLKTIKEYQVGTPDDWARIGLMKLQRGSFTAEQFEAILKYNRSECTMLAEVMNKLRDRLESVGLFLNSWHGAGAVSGTLMKRYEINKHIVLPDNAIHLEAIKRSYFGGRIQCVANGIFKEVYAYDIVSAYPSVQQNLCSLQGMRCTDTKHFDPDYPYACYDIEWDVPRSYPITPFPFRSPDGSIDYIFRGSGTYWQCEILEALKHFGPYIRIRHGYRLDGIDTTTRPFHYIPELFEHRKILKAKGDLAEKAIKLGLNGQYGKLAQEVGARNGKLPPYHSMIYAGLVTAGTRCQMLSAAMQSPENIIAFATDGICSRAPLDLSIGKNLGDWEETAYPKAFFLKAGMYQYVGTCGNCYKEGCKECGGVKHRGFPPESINWEIIEQIWNERGLQGKYKCPVRNFIGMKSASVNRPHCAWIDGERTINFYQRRFEHVLLTEDPRSYQLKPLFHLPGISAPYFKKATDYEDMTMEFTPWDD